MCLYFILAYPRSLIYSIKEFAPSFFSIIQALTIIAFSNEKINLDTFKKLLSVGPTFAVMNFIESELAAVLAI